MARHQSSCPWGIELAEAIAIFLAGIFIGALAVVAYRRHPNVTVVLLGVEEAGDRDDGDATR
jgi:hypothetical protein